MDFVSPAVAPESVILLSPLDTCIIYCVKDFVVLCLSGNFSLLSFIMPQFEMLEIA